MKELTQKHILTFTILILIFLLLIPLLKFSTQPLGLGDSTDYYEIAQSLPTFVGEAPWGYRILVPYLASILPFELKYNFMVISYTSFLFINLIIFYWFRGMGFSILQSFCTCLLYIFSFVGIYNFHNFIHIGLFEQLLFLIAFISIQKNKFLLLLSVVLFGSFAKETFILLIPLYFIVNFKKSEKKSIIFRTSILLIVYFLIFYLIRETNLFFSNYARFSVYTKFLVHNFFWDRIWSKPFNIIVVIMVAFTFWIPFAITGFLFSDKKTRLLSLLIAFTSSLLILGSDIERAVAISFPAFLLLFGSFLKLCKNREIILLICFNILVFLAYDHIWISASLYVPITWLLSIVFYICLRKRHIKNECLI